MKPRKLRMVEREAKVIKFLLSHPYSTADEVFAGCGEQVTTDRRFLIQETITNLESRPRVWRVNMLKYRHFLRTGNIDGKQHEPKRFTGGKLNP